tara:strand:- start:1720 stop:2136 length:417 start_codon:yes stop_codon:yes gene_type:complete
MIDTDKYEGHTPAPWTIELAKAEGGNVRRIIAMNIHRVDMALLADAPLLLAEVKRLREENEMLREELKNDDTGIKAIDGLLKAVGDRNEEVKRLQERLDWILGDEELAGYVWEKEVAYMEHEGVRLPWISADEWGEEE